MFCRIVLFIATATSFAAGAFIATWGPFDFQRTDLLLKMLQLVVTTIGVSVAVFGVNAWRVQHLGKEQYDVAKRILVNAYQLQTVIGQIRNPTLEEANKPLSALSSIGAELDLAFLESGIHWDSRLFPLRNELLTVTNKVSQARRKLSEARNSTPPKLSADELRQFGKIAESPSDAAGDAYAEELRVVVAKLEDALSHHLKK